MTMVLVLAISFFHQTLQSINLEDGYCVSCKGYQATTIISLTELKRMIMSEDWRIRQKSFSFAMRAIPNTNRQETADYLIKIVQNDPAIPHKNDAEKSTQARYSPKRVALAILAEWGVKESASVLVANIDYYARDITKDREIDPGYPTVDDYVAVKGLILVGKATIKLCLNELAKIDSGYGMARGTLSNEEHQRILTRQTNLLYVLEKLLGFKDAYSFIQEEIEAREPRSLQEAANLRNAESYLKVIETLRKK